MKIINKKSEKSLIDQFISDLKKDYLRKKKQNKRLSFVLTGGKSPKKLYRKLAQTNIDWKNIDLFWGDERYVSHLSRNSNYRLAFDELIKKIKINKKNIFPIKTQKSFLKCSIDYSIVIKKYFKNKKINFDYCLLGMGVDGHIASIFPGSENLYKKFITKTVIRKDFKRISIGLNVINNSKKILLWLNNKSKSKIYLKLKKEGKKIPVNNLNRKNTIIYKIN
jgi:6-phosphogluconolactonase